ncbi:hypothetical protein [Bacteroides sp. 224]|uniref:hypothetical protein n=1 Tax=Bacteroides sp. 224 TaxID=2302936 RepID=UPI0013D6BCE4|nr:hypothetical protein [Bacteroides sp. 224]NDV66817.1 hypothetical protein [Bacteroides sp. 224]
MKKLFIFSLTSLFLIACGENVEKKASAKLQEARVAFEEGNFSEAKLQIDSIKILYPKAFEARKEGIRLMQQVELKEQLQTRAYLEDSLKKKEEAFNAIKGRFVLEKDAEYQEIGNYLYPTQTIEKNLHRSFLRFQVNEKGEMSLTSIYCGAGNIHHHSVRVSVADGTFAETPSSKDIYETTDLGEKIEKADYKQGEDGNVMGFIYLNQDKNIKVEYLGDKKYTTSMLPNDRKALAEIYELAQILASMEQIKNELKEADLKINFVKRKIEEKEDPLSR